MSTTVTDTQRQRIIGLAQGAVFGVVNARLREDATDAALVIGEYMRDAVEICGEETTAWAMLFSAATVHFTDAVRMLAEANGQSPAAELTTFALAFAMDPA